MWIFLMVKYHQLKRHFQEQLNQTKFVGEIPIVSGTSISGAKTYSIPINIPDGLSEAATPSISIDYNSQADQGIVGQGWSITGLPSQR